MRKLLVLGLALLSGCAVNSEMTVKNWDSAGVITVIPSELPDYDYKVLVKTVKDPISGIDLNRPADRYTAVKTDLKHECQDIKVLGEQSTYRGKAPIGWELYTYTIKVKCIK